MEKKMHKDFSIVSLSCDKLELFINENSNELYTFNEFGETKKIPYKDFLKIEHYNMDKKEKGLYYILDDDLRERSDQLFSARKYLEA
jgi:hypothetical protein